MSNPGLAKSYFEPLAPGGCGPKLASFTETLISERRRI